MFSTKRLLVLFLLNYSFIQSHVAFSKEYNSLENYLKEHPVGKHDGKDGNWLKADRDKNTAVWNHANEINLQKQNGYLEYQNIYQRSNFFKWFRFKTDSLGFETRWAKAAITTTKKLKNLLSPVALLTGNSNHEIQFFIEDGNRIIFDDIWKDLKSLYEHQPLKGKDAEIWDGHLLLKEQNLIEPSYRKLGNNSLKKLEKLLRRENMLSRVLPGYEFDGNLLSIRDRWLYGMKMMGYRNPDINL